MEHALLKVKLTKKLNPMQLFDEIVVMECRFNLSVNDRWRRVIALMAAGKENTLILSLRDHLYQTSM